MITLTDNGTISSIRMGSLIKMFNLFLNRSLLGRQVDVASTYDEESYHDGI
jgi:hypothetical protein